MRWGLGDSLHFLTADTLKGHRGLANPLHADWILVWFLVVRRGEGRAVFFGGTPLGGRKN